MKGKQEVEVKYAGLYESGDLPLFDEGIADAKLDDRPVEECNLSNYNLFTKGVSKPDDRPFIRALVKLHRAKAKDGPRPVRMDVTLSIRAANQDLAVDLLTFLGTLNRREGVPLDLELGEVK